MTMMKIYRVGEMTLTLPLFKGCACAQVVSPCDNSLIARG